MSRLDRHVLTMHRAAQLHQAATIVCLVLVNYVRTESDVAPFNMTFGRLRVTDAEATARGDSVANK